MSEIFWHSDFTSNTERELKILTLYYDKINITNERVRSFHFNFDSAEFILPIESDFIPKTFNRDYKLLIDEKILCIDNKTRSLEESSPYLNEIDKSGIMKALKINENLIVSGHSDGRDTLTEEAFSVLKNQINYEPGRTLISPFIWTYYGMKLQSLVESIGKGNKCINSSNIINRAFSTFIKESDNQNKYAKIVSHKSLALDAIQMNLPNPEDLSFEDILDLKLQLKDELKLFSQTINEIEVRNKQLFDVNFSEREYQALFFNEIQKPFNDLKNKMKNLNSQKFRKFTEKLSNPYTYTPLLGSMCASIPMQYALLFSLGLIGTQSYLEYLEDKRELSNNGFYFLLKLK